MSAAPLPATAPASLWHSAFYRFAPLQQPEAVAQALRSLGAGLPGLTGALLVAAEGVNGAVAGDLPAVQAFEEALRVAPWWPAADTTPAPLPPLVFKRSPCERPPFFKFKVRVKPRIVALDLPTDSLPDESDPRTQAGRLSPQAWREALKDPNTVVLDNRNHFEFRLGHFAGALDPQVQHFRDFCDYVQRHAPDWQREGKRVAMYCTGGIRCERTAPWMRSLGLEVFELEGGILNYFQSLPDADQDWQGHCFVFDRRLAVDTHLLPVPLEASEVYDPRLPDEAWRLARARRLDHEA